jgi:hypothetical protein
MPEGIDLRDALDVVRRDGAAYLPRFLASDRLGPLRREVDAGPFRDMTGEHGKMRMESAGFDVAMPMSGFPLMRRLAGELGAAVREGGTGIRGLASWRPNEIGVARYRPGSLGITPHLDGKWYRRLVVVVTIYGTARFAVCRSREGDIVAEWHPGPGDLVLMRGPGLAGQRDGRPFHLVEGPRRGERCSLGVRMAVDAPR